MDKAIDAKGVHAAWNTGREYGEQKQRVSATVLADGRVAFADVDRGIEGCLHVPFYSTPVNSVELAEFVMQEYDHGQYCSGFSNLTDRTYTYDEVDEIIADLRSAAKSIGADGLRTPGQHELPGVADDALAVLMSYPYDSLISDFYDSDKEFSTAVGELAGPGFEYPDYSHKTVEQFCIPLARERGNQSLADANVMARDKAKVELASCAGDKSYVGKVMGLTACHVVMSLGRSALIMSRSNLDVVPEKGSDIAVTFQGGRGTVVEKSIDKSISR